jgi:hypothetical protein
MTLGAAFGVLRLRVVITALLAAGPPLPLTPPYNRHRPYYTAACCRHETRKGSSRYCRSAPPRQHAPVRSA